MKKSRKIESPEKRLSPILIASICVALAFAISLFVRIYFPYDKVFVGDWIKVTTVDGYYQLRVVDNLVFNFPHLMHFDPYLNYPFSLQIHEIHFYNRLLAAIIWLISLGSPTQHMIDVVGTYFPAVLAALTVIPVYFIGKELFGRWVGVLGAMLIAIMPGEFLGRSILSNTDHHIAEVLFSTTAVMFLVLAIKAARNRGLTFAHLQRREWTVLAKPLLYGVLSGLFLGLYLITWIGALLFVFILFAYFVVQFIIDHLRQRSVDYLCPVGISIFLVALVIFAPVSSQLLTILPIIIALFTPLVLIIVSRWLVSKKIKPIYYPLTLLGFAGVGLGVFFLAAPNLTRELLKLFDVFNPGIARTISEMQPLLSPGGTFTWAIAWGNFTTGFFLSLICLGILLYFVIKQERAELTLLTVWSLIILVATLGQRRFAYYFAVNVSLLTGYLSVVIYYLARLIVEYFAGRSTSYLWSQILEFSGFRAQRARLVDTPKQDYYEVLGISRKATTKQIRKAFRNLASRYQLDTKDRADEKFKEINEAYQVLSNPGKRAAYDRLRYGRSIQEVLRKKSSKRGFGVSINYTSMALGVIAVVFLLGFFPNPRQVIESNGQAWWRTCLIGTALATASQTPYAPSDAWVSSLLWLKENSPEPFGDADFYYQLYRSAAMGEKYKPPESAYGVMAWGDYGFWIARIGRRPALLLPGPGGKYVAIFLLSQDENSTQKIKWDGETIMESEIIQKLDAEYIILDYETVTTKSWALAKWGEKHSTEFFDVYYVPQEDKLRPVWLFHPPYYRSLMVRLYNFDGQEVTPKSSTVISYEDREVQNGVIKLITNVQTFPSYEEATNYISSQKSGNYRIVSDDPFTSPVPLTAVQHFKLIHSSDNTTTPSGGSVPSVKIFQYIR